VSLRQGRVNVCRGCVKGKSNRLKVAGGARMLGCGRAVVGGGPECWKGSAADGRCGLRRGVAGRVSGAGTGFAWVGAVVTGAGVLANVVGGVLALLLIIYLFVALVKPEKF